jgi:ribosomal protein S12 methylthiotransferase RimO
MTTDISAPTTELLSVAMVTLGCARNEVDSEELAGRLEAGGFLLVEDPSDADTVVVNTCGFVESAKKDSVDTLLAAADLKATGHTQAVVAVGCMAERYGKELQDSLPEADAVLGFDDYPDIAERLRSIVAGEVHEAHTPQDRRKLLPITPVERALSTAPVPGHASGPASLRRRLDSGPTASLKLASGCDRRCSFCAIPAFRGSFVSRRPSDVLQEARWLGEQGVRELFLVSENSTSYGKDLGDLRLLETLLPELAAVEGVERVRVSYLQPAETRPGLVQAIASTPGVTPYFDLSFQHASADVLRRMRRFGDPESFLGLLEQIRALAPEAGVRSNVIVGFPGESDEDLQTLCDFLVAARLDVTGVFGYSDEDGTEAATYDGKLDDDEVRARVEHVGALVEELTSQRAADRIDETVEVLVEHVAGDGADGSVEGRSAHQGPEVDGSTFLLDSDAQVGDLVRAVVVESEGADLYARVL